MRARNRGLYYVSSCALSSRASSTPPSSASQPVTYQPASTYQPSSASQSVTYQPSLAPQSVTYQPASTYQPSLASQPVTYQPVSTARPLSTAQPVSTVQSMQPMSDEPQNLQVISSAGSPELMHTHFCQPWSEYPPFFGWCYQQLDFKKRSKC